MTTPKKPSKTRSIFTTFASSRFLNREQVIAELKETAQALKKSRCDIEAVYLFGSFASGVPTPKSDADLLIVADESDVDEIRAVFHSVSVPVELFIVTPTYFQQKLHAGKGVVAAAAREGIRLL